MGILTSLMSTIFTSAVLSKKTGPHTEPQNAITSAAITAADVIDTLFTSDEERLDKQAVLARIALHADTLQTKINQSESQHRSRFVAGWRPCRKR